MTLDDILDFITSRPSKEKQSFDGSLRWYLSRSRFVFYDARLVRDRASFWVEVSVGTPSGKPRTFQVQVPSKEEAFTCESAEKAASVILKSSD